MIYVLIYLLIGLVMAAVSILLIEENLTVAIFFLRLKNYWWMIVGWPLIIFWLIIMLIIQIFV